MFLLFNSKAEVLASPAIPLVGCHLCARFCRCQAYSSKTAAASLAPSGQSRASNIATKLVHIKLIVGQLERWKAWWNGRQKDRQREMAKNGRGRLRAVTIDYFATQPTPLLQLFQPSCSSSSSLFLFFRLLLSFTQITRWTDRHASSKPEEGLLDATTSIKYWCSLNWILLNSKGALSLPNIRNYSCWQRKPNSSRAFEPTTSWLLDSENTDQVHLKWTTITTLVTATTTSATSHSAIVNHYSSSWLGANNTYRVYLHYSALNQPAWFSCHNPRREFYPQFASRSLYLRFEVQLALYSLQD